MSIPKDGYYVALVQCDSGGEVGMHVEVRNSIPLTRQGKALLQSACSQFMEVSTSEFCRVWSKDAATELETLRTANKALVESIRDRERERDHASDVADAVVRENSALADRVKRLEAWGDRLEELLGDPPNANCSCHISPPCNDCVEWAAIREAKAEWSQAKEAKP